MYNLVDDTNKVLAESCDETYLLGLKRVLLAPARDVSEHDEVIYAKYLYNDELCWHGNLTIKSN